MPEHRIEFRAQSVDDRRFYAFEVDGGAITADDSGAYPYDRISNSGTHATGVVAGDGVDAYTYTGEVANVFVDGDIEVAYDGSVVHPDSLEPDPLADTILPEFLAQKYDQFRYDEEMEMIDVAGSSVWFHWPTLRDFFGLGGGE